MSDYKKKIQEEIGVFKDNVDVHRLPSAHDYWSSKYLYPTLNRLGFSGYRNMFIHHILRAAKSISAPPHIVSLGSGNCDFEVSLAGQLEEEGQHEYLLECVDINRDMLDRGREAARRLGRESRFIFTVADLNVWKPSGVFDIALANHSLHHVLGLEHLFDTIGAHLHGDGYFLINDMIGRNGHMRWPEAEFFVRILWRSLESRHRYNHQLRQQHDEFLNWDCSKKGFEGIRAQDILPLLTGRFSFPFFLAFKNLISPFVGRSYGPNFDSNNTRDRAIIDTVATLDERLIEAGILTPTQMFAALSVGRTAEPIYWRHLTPDFCLRDPAAPPPFGVNGF